jgi:hypothetical protein
MVDYDKIMQGFHKIAAEREAEAKAKGIKMKTTSFHTVSFGGCRADLEFDPNGELTEDQNDKAVRWFVNEVNNALPEWATWIPATSEIIVPIDNVRDMEEFFEKHSWEDVVNEVCEKYIDQEWSIINSDEE